VAEKVIIRQNRHFETDILAQDHHDPDAEVFEPVAGVHQLTPYGMLLAGLGSCTTIVLHTYAQYHDVPLEEIEITLSYDRVFADDCKDCAETDEYTEQINEEINLIGNLTPADKKKLHVISKHCPIHQMLLQGIEVLSHLAPDK
jgi:putative redox protein